MPRSEPHTPCYKQGIQYDWLFIAAKNFINASREALPQAGTTYWEGEMVYLEDEIRSVEDLGGIDVGPAVIPVDALRKFEDVVRSLGGEPAALLAKSHLDAAIFDNRKAVISYRAMVNLLERVAVELKCPDFGMRLAAAQDATKVLYGPLGLAMRNSRTVGEAYRFCASHAHI
jgi:hypothetical protein